MPRRLPRAARPITLAATFAVVAGCQAILGIDEGQPRGVGGASQGGQAGAGLAAGNGGTGTGTGTGGAGGTGSCFGPLRPVRTDVYGGAGIERATGVAFQGDRIVMVGNFRSPSFFGGATLNAIADGQSDVFVAWYDRTGAFAGQQSFHGNGHQHAKGVALHQGEMFVVGDFVGSIEFPSGNILSAQVDGNIESYLVKLNAGGIDVWYRHFHEDTITSARTEIEAVAVDHTGAVIVAGSFTRSLHIDGVHQGEAYGANHNAFVTRLENDGSGVTSQVFTPALDASGETWATEIAAIPGTTDFIIGGWFQGSLELENRTLGALDSMDHAWVARLDSVFNDLWAHEYGGVGGNTRLTGVAAPSASEILVTGTFEQGTLDLAGTPVDQDGTASPGTFVAKLAGNGDTLTADSPGGGDPDHVGAHALAVDPQGNPIYVGQFKGDKTFGGHVFQAPTIANPFIAKLQGDLSYMSSWQIVADQISAAHAVAIDDCGRVVVVGEVSSSTVLALLDDTGTNAGSFGLAQGVDAFLLLLAP